MVSQQYHYSKRHHTSHALINNTMQNQDWLEEGYKGMQNMHPNADRIKVMVYSNRKNAY